MGGFALAQWYGVGLRFVRSRVRSPAPLSYNEITSGCCDLALAPYGRIHVVNLTMAHMILGSIVHWRHYHWTFKSMRLGGLVIVQWRISSPGIYMVFPLISPLFLFLILTVQLLVKSVLCTASRALCSGPHQGLIIGTYCCFARHLAFRSQSRGYALPKTGAVTVCMWASRTKAVHIYIGWLSS